ncbi:MAG: hypothetical protein IJW03_01495 [Clostridia bacterium]|nr:hypothetical protein [Clostridia bacterium]
MKNSKIAKLVAISLSVLLLVGAIVMISATADDAADTTVVTTDKLGVASLNLSYKAQTEIAFAVYDGLDAVVSGGQRDIYLLFFATDPDASGELTAEELYKNAIARKESVGNVNLGGVSHLLFYSNGIMANDLAKSVYVCPVAVEKVPVAGGEGYTTNYVRGYTTKKLADDGVTFEYDYSARACNPVSYARQKIVESMISGEEMKPADAKLYSNIISYAAAALAKQGEKLVFEDATLVVSGGTIAGNKDGATTTTLDVKGYPADATVLLRAEAKNAAGEYFLRWEDIDGNSVCTERIFANAPVHNDMGYVTYTAVYGSQSESIYKDVIDLENLVEAVDDNYVSVSDPLVGTAQTPASGTVRVYGYFYENTTKQKVIDLINKCVYAADDTSESGYTLTAQTDLRLVDDSYGMGDKNLYIAATNGALRQWLYNTRTEDTDVFETDIKINSITAEGNFTRFIVEGTNCSFTVNVAVYGNETDGYTVKVGSFLTKALYNNSTDPLATPVTDASLVEGYKLSSLDEIITLRCVIDDSGDRPVATVSVNGVQLFCGSATSQTGYTNGYFSSVKTTYAAGNNALSIVYQHFHTGVTGALTLDNIWFTDN